ncbi:MAG: DUF3737 family protein [Clostridia bacterium]|nr:DUF3737 family protein [Clostridia bacterium]
MAIITNRQFDEERALYHLQDSAVQNCIFAGPADGESALKEARNITVEDCSFSLRYPFWHTADFSVRRCTMDALTRAAIWYAENGTLEDCKLYGIKALRECENIQLTGCDIISPEFGWRSRKLQIDQCSAESEYFLFECRDVSISELKMKGKYSFQYIENMTLENSELDTKDAFWHTKNVTAKNCIIKGEYLGWYSENLTLIDCKISGTQPLCYCKNLVLKNCTMTDCDLSFEYSTVEADIIGTVDSVKNPISGHITADGYGEIILEDAVYQGNCDIKTRTE